ncbi:unnamed protein product [Didymodactylos carnosus]|uniref:Chromo domain-containing protein n=1 Tax=Didymodactylos carnosus TaxID=1234261 RepID=A0A816EZS2_9BILA|nr:unnamed protein product [Didymodactylos carnosus]CAF1652717.1 unnamed protein product [Didymodactylos carnosus]CAF4410463.1 unnamed protein product [Didymodactylos carnosus]CAF4584192.1 unnamed protein product [Didymodactylos carnosus]
MKTKRGQNYYYLKWKNFDESENTWEPESHLDCPELISDFLANRPPKPVRISSSSASRSRRRLTRKRSEEDEENRQPSTSSTQLAQDQTHPSSGRRPRVELEQTGYSRGQIPEKIMGATDVHGELMFLIKWQGIEKTELVPARIVNTKSAQMVIKFYEDRLTWADQNVEDA